MSKYTATSSNHSGGGKKVNTNCKSRIRNLDVPLMIKNSADKKKYYAMPDKIFNIDSFGQGFYIYYASSHVEVVAISGNEHKLNQVVS
jgi:hypothetical protein